MRAVEASSRNEAVIQQAQNEVRSAQASIKFLEDELAKLQMGAGSPAGTPRKGEGSGSTPGSGRGYQPGMMSPPRGPGAQESAGVSPSPSRTGIADGRDRPLPPPPPGAEADEAMRRPEQKNYTQLGGFASK
jgi:classical protein kinase C/novel protein kinase C epsilon type